MKANYARIAILLRHLRYYTAFSMLIGALTQAAYSQLVTQLDLVRLLSVSAYNQSTAPTGGNRHFITFGQGLFDHSANPYSGQDPRGTAEATGAHQSNLTVSENSITVSGSGSIHTIVSIPSISDAYAVGESLSRIQIRFRPVRHMRATLSGSCVVPSGAITDSNYAHITLQNLSVPLAVIGSPPLGRSASGRPITPGPASGSFEVTLLAGVYYELSAECFHSQGSSVVGAFDHTASFSGFYFTAAPIQVTLAPLVRQTGGSILVSGSAVPNAPYLLQASENLVSWVNIASITSSSNGSFSASDPAASQFTRRFYRVIE